MNVTIRAAAPGDAAALAAIYAPYVEKTAITFEYTAPTAQEFAGRIEHTLAKYPYLVAEGDGEILGYAYAGVFKGRTAYDWTAEVSIYLREDRRRAGLGSLLYDALEQCLVRQNIKTLIAAITYPETEDEYVTKASVQFHLSCGYKTAGIFRSCGYKFGRWYDTAWMEKHIAPHEDTPAAVVPFGSIADFLPLSVR